MEQSPHVDADEFAGCNPDHRGQGSVNAQDLVGLIVDHDEIGDGVKDFQPVAVRLFNASEQARIVQGHGGVCGYSFQQIAVFGRERTGASGEAEQPSELSIGSRKPNRH